LREQAPELIGRAAGRVGDDEAVDAFHLLAETEGIVPALETAHALAWVGNVAGRLRRDDAVLVNLSGRGDKDVAEVARLEGITL